MRLVDVLPLPSLRAQRLIAAAVVLTQGGIAVTGAIVRVTASGLGCPTWPQCFPGSFTPVPHAEVAGIHQAVEFGNRMITFLVVLTAALAVLAVTRARRRREVLVYAWLMPASTVMQAVIGGITVLTGLLWWTVAIHLLVSMAMVWLAVLLYVKIGEPDDGVPTVRVPKPLRQLTILTASVLSAVLVTGTLVTAAGPHAGDKSIEAPVPRLQIEIVTLVHPACDAAAGLSGASAGTGPRAAQDQGRPARHQAAGRIADPRRGAGPGWPCPVRHRGARRAGGDPRGGRGRVYGSHLGAMGVDARTGRARAGPALTQHRSRTSAAQGRASSGPPGASPVTAPPTPARAAADCPGRR